MQQRDWTALETLAEVSRQIEANEKQPHDPQQQQQLQQPQHFSDHSQMQQLQAADDGQANVAASGAVAASLFSTGSFQVPDQFNMGHDTIGMDGQEPKMEGPRK